MDPVLYVAIAVVGSVAAQIAWQIWRGSRMARRLPLGETPRKPPGKYRTVQERMTLKQYQYVTKLEKSDPAKFAAIMDKRLGIAKEDDEMDVIDKMVRTRERLHKAGMISEDDERGGSDNSRIAEKLIEGLAPAFGPVLAGIVQQQQQAQQGQQPVPVQQAQPVTIDQTAQPVAAIEAAPMPDVPGLPERPAVGDEAPKMGMVDRMLIGLVDGKPANQAAMVLCNHRNPQIHALVDALRQCSEDVLPRYVEHVSGQVPYLAWWVSRPERWPWFVLVTREIRQIPAA